MMRIAFICVFALAPLLLALQQRPVGSATESMYRSAADSGERKFRHIERNGQLSRPDQTPTVLTDREVNAYLATGKVEFPVGVKSVRFMGKPGVIQAVTRVNFDEITASQGSLNPLLALFKGTHDVSVTARGEASGGMATVHVESVEMNGVRIPRAALEFFLDRYVTPNYPEVMLDTRFELPHKIDLAIVGDGSNLRFRSDARLTVPETS